MMNTKEEHLLEQMHSIIHELGRINSKEDKSMLQEDVKTSKLEFFYD